MTGGPPRCFKTEQVQTMYDDDGWILFCTLGLRCSKGPRTHTKNIKTDDNPTITNLLTITDLI